MIRQSRISISLPAPRLSHISLNNPTQTVSSHIRDDRQFSVGCEMIKHTANMIDTDYCRLRHPSAEEVLRILHARDAWKDRQSPEGRLQSVDDTDACGLIREFFLFEYWGLAAPKRFPFNTIEEHCNLIAAECFVIDFREWSTLGIECMTAGIFLGMRQWLKINYPASDPIVPSSRISDIAPESLWQLMLLVDRSLPTQGLCFTVSLKPGFYGNMLRLGVFMLALGALLFFLPSGLFPFVTAGSIALFLLVVGSIVTLGSSAVMIAKDHVTTTGHIRRIAVSGCITFKHLAKAITDRLGTARNEDGISNNGT